MIYHGMTPNPALSAGMVLTELDKSKLVVEKLDKHCQSTDNTFLARNMISGRLKTGRKFSTIRECNEYARKMPSMAKYQ